jgi:hypothetical protein
MSSPTALELVTTRRAEVYTLLGQIGAATHMATETWADAGDLSRVIAGLKEALRVLTSGEG